jgi:hypothetical protein
MVVNIRKISDVTSFTLSAALVLDNYNIQGLVRFQVLTVASMEFRIFWDVLQCSQIDVD